MPPETIHWAGTGFSKPGPIEDVMDLREVLVHASALADKLRGPLPPEFYAGYKMALLDITDAMGIKL